MSRRFAFAPALSVSRRLRAQGGWLPAVWSQAAWPQAVAVLPHRGYSGAGVGKIVLEGSPVGAWGPPAWRSVDSAVDAPYLGDAALLDAADIPVGSASYPAEDEAASTPPRRGPPSRFRSRAPRSPPPEEQGAVAELLDVTLAAWPGSCGGGEAVAPKALRPVSAKEALGAIVAAAEDASASSPAFEPRLLHAASANTATATAGAEPLQRPSLQLTAVQRPSVPAAASLGVRLSPELGAGCGATALEVLALAVADSLADDGSCCVEVRGHGPGPLLRALEAIASAREHLARHAPGEPHGGIIVVVPRVDEVYDAFPGDAAATTEEDKGAWRTLRQRLTLACVLKRR